MKHFPVPQSLIDARKRKNETAEKAREAKDLAFDANADLQEATHQFINDAANQLGRNRPWQGANIVASHGGLRWNFTGWNAGYRLNPFRYGTPERDSMDTLLEERIRLGGKVRELLDDCHALDTKIYDLTPPEKRGRLFNIDWSKFNDID